MTRIIVVNMLLFFAPFVLVWLWTRFIQTRQPTARSRRHYAIAAIAGLTLVVISLLTYRVNSGNEPGGTYVPPHYKDGQIIPGRFE